MDEFTYTNIFETKGIEYLVIIAFLLLLIPFWVLLNKQLKINKKFQKVIGGLTAYMLRIPQGLFYCKNHTWAYLEKSGSARVGLDDLLLHITGEVSFRNLKKPGETINKGELIAEIGQKAKLLRIYSPISGVIMNINSEITDNPGILNEDPYDLGWLFKIKPSKWVAETSSYYLAGEAINWSRKELERFKDFLILSTKKYSPEPIMTVLQDGGELRDNSLSELPDEIWQDFQKSFLTIPGEN